MIKEEIMGQDEVAKKGPFNNEKRGVVFFYEFIGTALFLYCVLMTRDPAAVCFTLFGATVIFGRVSGGHFNPAVSTAIFFGQDTSEYGKNAVTYLLMVLAQILAAAPAIGLAQLTLFSGKISHVELNRIHRLCPQSTTNMDFPRTFVCENQDGKEGFHMDMQILIMQTLGTLVLSFVLNFVQGKHCKSTDDALKGLAYSATFMLLIYTGRRQGWCFNPAIAGTLGVFELYNAPNAHHNLSRYLYAYCTGPIVGAVLAAFIYKCYNAELEPPKAEAAPQQQDQAAKDDADDDEKAKPTTGTAAGKNEGEMINTA